MYHTSYDVFQYVNQTIAGLQRAIIGNTASTTLVLSIFLIFNGIILAVLTSSVPDERSRGGDTRRSLKFPFYFLLQGLGMAASIYTEFIPDYRMLEILQVSLLATAFLILLHEGLSILKFAGKAKTLILIIAGSGAVLPCLIMYHLPPAWVVFSTASPAYITITVAMIYSIRRQRNRHKSLNFTVSTLLHAFYGIILCWLTGSAVIERNADAGFLGSNTTQTTALIMIAIVFLVCMSYLALRRTESMTTAPFSGRTIVNMLAFMLFCLLLSLAAFIIPVSFESRGLDEAEAECMEKAKVVTYILDKTYSISLKQTTILSRTQTAVSSIKSQSNVTKAIKSNLESFESEMPGHRLYVATPSGICVAASESNSKAIGNAVPAAECVAAAMKNGKATDFSTDQENGRQIICTAVRINSEKGEPLGVALMTSDAKIVFQTVKNDDFFALVNPSGKIVLTNCADMLDKRVSEVTRTELLFNSEPLANPRNLFKNNTGKRDVAESAVFTCIEINSHISGWTLILGTKNSYPAKLRLAGISLILIICIVAFSIWVFISLQAKIKDDFKKHLEWKNAIFVNNPSGILIVNEHDRIIDANGTASSMLGYALEELIGMRFRKLHTSRESTLLSLTISSNLIESGGQHEGEIDLKRKDGSVMVCRASARRLSQADRNDDSGMVIWALSDETKQHVIQEKLKESEQRHRTLVESSSDHISMMNRKGEILSSNDQIIAQAVAKGEKRGVRPSISDFYSEETTNYYMAMIENVFIMKEPLTFQHSTKSGGVEKYFMDTLYPIIKNGEVTAVGNISKDITPLKRIEDSLKKSERRFKDIGRSATDIIWEIDRNLKLSYCSENLESKLGYSISDIINTSPFESFFPDDRKKFERFFSRAMKNPRPFKLRECKITTAYEYHLWFMVSALPVFDDFGNFEGYRGICTDITDFKLIEIELKSRVDSANAATKAKTEFMACMSHEIRTPMNGVLNMTGLLLETDLNQEQQLLAKTILSSARHLTDMVTDILDIAKIEAGKIELSMRPCSIREITAEVIKMFARKAADKNIDIDVSVSANVPVTVLSAPVRLRQILINLISNAVKYTDSGRMTIDVDAVRQSAGDSAYSVSFRIEDTGMGIPKEKLGSIFESFSRVDSEKVSSIDGTGLGLNISRRLVTVLGGTISAQSELEKGSVFTVNIPLQSLDASDKNICITHPDDVDYPHCLNADILLVDDSRSSMMISEKILMKLGCRVTSASSGEEALKIFGMRPFDAVLMDINLSGINGMETAVEMRRIESSSGKNRTPIIALTASSGTETERKIIDSGMDSFLFKPVSLQSTARKLSEYLKLQKKQGSHV